MNKLFICFLLLVSCLTCVSFAQSKRIVDSLQQVYQTATHDTTKILAQLEIMQQYRHKPDTILLLAKETESKSKMLNFLRGQALTYFRLTHAYLSKGNYPEVLDHANKGIAIFGQLKDSINIARIFNNMGSVYYNKGAYPQALEYYIQALAIHERHNETKNAPLMMTNIGMVYAKNEHHQEALFYHQEALKLYEKQKDKGGIAISLNNLGLIAMNTGDSLTAMRYFEKSLAIRQQLNDKVGMAINLTNLGVIAYKQDSLEKALRYYQQSLDIRQQLNDKRGIIYSLKGLAEVFNKQKQYNLTKETALQALEIAKSLEMNFEIRHLYQVLYDNSKDEKDYLQALYYYEQYAEVSNKIYSLERVEKINKLEKQFQLEKKESEIILLSKNQELLKKDAALNRIAAEKAQAMQLIMQKEAEAIRLLTLSKEEKNKHKQDSLQNLAQKNQLEAENLKIKAEKLETEAQIQTLATQKAQEEQRFQQIVIVITLLSLLGALISLIWIISNRQKIQKANKNLKLANEEISQQKEEILQQAENLQIVNQTKDKLFAIIGHDLRNPIASLKGMLDLVVSQDISQEEFAHFAPKLAEGVEYMHFTLNNLLLWANSQLRGIESKPEMINLYNLAQENCNLLKEMAINKKIELVNELPNNLQGYADLQQINLIFRNLIGNALKFTAEGGTVKVILQITNLENNTNIFLKNVSAEQTLQNFWQIGIADTGVGMSVEQISQLFKQNTSLTTYGTEGEKGTGLGLLLCQEMAEKNGGKIWVESELDKGATFWFTVMKTQ
jgi:signal transduction histidine kinase/Tfp pilus assembly protein PilF